MGPKVEKQHMETVFVKVRRELRVVAVISTKCMAEDHPGRLCPAAKHAAAKQESICGWKTDRYGSWNGACFSSRRESFSQKIGRAEDPEPK
jgi:hypothetical protein